MKPITPAEAKAPHPEDDAEVAAVIERVDKILKDHNWNATQYEKRCSVQAKILGSNSRVRDRVLALYHQATWKVERVSDQRDGDFYWFS